MHHARYVYKNEVDSEKGHVLTRMKKKKDIQDTFSQIVRHAIKMQKDTFYVHMRKQEER